MASSSDEPQEHGGPLRVLFLASEWGSSKGGLSTVNRELAINVAKFPEVHVTFFVPQCNDKDKEAAREHKIDLVEATRIPGMDELMWLCFPSPDMPIDVVVGHGLKLGPQAKVIRNSHNCKWVQFVHTAPEELSIHKEYPNAISSGDKKHATEVELCELADFVVTIGPKLYETFYSYLCSCKSKEKVFNFTPSIFCEFSEVAPVLDRGGNFRVLLFGRGDAEDFSLKGFDIAAQAIAELGDIRLLFVGAPVGKEEEVKERFLECGIRNKDLTVRGFSPNRERLRKTFFEVDVAVMPSRAEGFGLTGLEALSAGLPILVSRNSGFGEALSKVTFGSYSVNYSVIDSHDAQVWAKAIKDIKEKDKKQRLEEAGKLRTSYKNEYRWDKQSKELIGKMMNLVQGSNKVRVNPNVVANLTSQMRAREKEKTTTREQLTNLQGSLREKNTYNAAVQRQSGEKASNEHHIDLKAKKQEIANSQLRQKKLDVKQHQANSDLRCKLKTNDGKMETTTSLSTEFQENVDPATSQERVTDLGELRKKEHQTKKTREQLVAFERQVKEKDIDNPTLQEQITKLQRELSTNEKEVPTMRGQLAILREQLATPQWQLEEEQQRANHLKAKLRTKKREMRTLRKHLTNVHGQLQEKDTDNAALNEQITELQGKLSTSEEEVTTMRERMTDLLRQVQEKDTENATLQEQITALQETLRTKEEAMTAMREQLSNLQVQEEHFEEQRTLVTEPLETNEEEMNCMRAQLRETQQRETNLNRTFSVCQRDNPRDWVINRNEIHLTSHELGRGAWGHIVRGKFRGCDVAVKQMYAIISYDYSRRLFEREVDIASRCRHPCLLQFIAATADDNPPLLVTEIMDCSLRERLYNDDDQPLSTEEVSVISLDVARALNYLHQKQPNPIIHRDISSTNVLLWRHGDLWRGKVSDYGTANFVRQSTLYGVGAVIYSAPESLNENPNQPISCKVDVYSFGVLLCEMCIREQPDPESRERQVAVIENSTFGHLVRSCIEREPRMRPNVEEIIEYLDIPEAEETRGWFVREQVEMLEQDDSNEVELECSKKIWSGQRRMLDAVDSDKEEFECWELSSLAPSGSGTESASPGSSSYHDNCERSSLKCLPAPPSYPRPQGVGVRRLTTFQTSQIRRSGLPQKYPMVSKKNQDFFEYREDPWLKENEYLEDALGMLGEKDFTEEELKCSKKKIWSSRRKMFDVVEKEPESSGEENLKPHGSPCHDTCEKSSPKCQPTPPPYPYPKEVRVRSRLKVKQKKKRSGLLKKECQRRSKNKQEVIEHWERTRGSRNGIARKRTSRKCLKTTISMDDFNGEDLECSKRKICSTRKKVGRLQ